MIFVFGFILIIIGWLLWLAQQPNGSYAMANLGYMFGIIGFILILISICTLAWRYLP